eukprot:COSAG02_NODE_14659_length_1250_cov_2.385752_1_plen_219_part_00
MCQRTRCSLHLLDLTFRCLFLGWILHSHMLYAKEPRRPHVEQAIVDSRNSDERSKPAQQVEWARDALSRNTTTAQLQRGGARPSPAVPGPAHVVPVCTARAPVCWSAVSAQRDLVQLQRDLVHGHQAQTEYGELCEGSRPRGASPPPATDVARARAPAVCLPMDMRYVLAVSECTRASGFFFLARTSTGFHARWFVQYLLKILCIPVRTHWYIRFGSG